ncbi:MAG: hypothetical protein JO271_09050 [Verrucomicrobia bacterium]|nr:hypothetical protein [Verrucomicrobiota bacterium]MBV9273876.1 hypothetical protein [Verrucomicrobiota bacterium]
MTSKEHHSVRAKFFRASLGAIVVVCLIGCTVGPTTPKGQMTMQGRGSEALTDQGDPLMSTGDDERRVPIDFAKGYAKGISDQVKRTYWAQQEGQREAKTNTEGEIKYYNATIPEHQDPDGVVRVEREVVIPIVE